MPTASNRGVDLFYDTDGEGDLVAFVPDVGLGAWAWGWQHAAVAGPYESLVYDLRGTGRSDAPPGPYDVATLAADLEAVLAAHEARTAHLVGLGLGGQIALQHALDYSRAASLTLVGTAATGSEIDADALAATRGAGGESRPGEAGAVDDLPTDLPELDVRTARATLPALLSDDFLDAQPDVADGVAEWRADEDAGPRGWRAQAAAALAFEVSGPLYEVTVPALVLHGEADRVVPHAAGEALAGDLPNGAFDSWAGAGHLVTVERSRPLNDRLLAFLDDVGDPARG